MAIILLVEDEMYIHQMVKEYLEKRHDQCISAFSGTEALLQYKMKKPDVILLDLMLPGMCGEDVIVNIKKQDTTPIIVMSAKDDLEGKVNVLEKGADDYVCKPFALEELYARIQVQLRRKATSKQTQNITYQNICLLPDHHTLMIDQNKINLTKHEYRIMELLLKHPKQGFTKQEIYEYAWDDAYVIDDKTIHVHISNIRNKCNPYKGNIIETIWGIGFKLKA